MKQLLLAPFLLGFISPVNAETVWLILAYGNSGVEKIGKFTFIIVGKNLIF